eukprot:g21815.t1
MLQPTFPLLFSLLLSVLGPSYPPVVTALDHAGSFQAIHPQAGQTCAVTDPQSCVSPNVWTGLCTCPDNFSARLVSELSWKCKDPNGHWVQLPTRLFDCMPNEASLVGYQGSLTGSCDNYPCSDCVQPSPVSGSCVCPEVSSWVGSVQLVAGTTWRQRWCAQGPKQALRNWQGAFQQRFVGGELASNVVRNWIYQALLPGVTYWGSLRNPLASCSGAQSLSAPAKLQEGPGRYTGPMSCTWVIYNARDLHVHILAGEESYDHLTVYEGAGVGGNVLAIRAFSPFADLRSQTGILTVVWEADPSLNNEGFELWISSQAPVEKEVTLITTMCHNFHDCLAVPAPCYPLVTCTDLPSLYGDAVCGPCPPGYQGDGRECSLAQCPPHSARAETSADTNSSPGTCVCKEGYVGNLTWGAQSYQGDCTFRACPRYSRREGNGCMCAVGFQGTVRWQHSLQDWSGECADVDECVAAGVCPPRAPCVDAAGSFHCLSVPIDGSLSVSLLPLHSSANATISNSSLSLPTSPAGEAANSSSALSASASVSWTEDTVLKISFRVQLNDGVNIPVSMQAGLSMLQTLQASTAKFDRFGEKRNRSLDFSVPSNLISSPRPLIYSNTLRHWPDGASGSFLAIEGKQASGSLIAFQGRYFGSDPSLVQVSYGPYDCGVVPDLFSSQQLVCRTTPFSGGVFSFEPVQPIVMVNGRICSILGIFNDTYISCRLPAGVGVAGVSVSSSTTYTPLYRDLIRYARPKVIAISSAGCRTRSQDLLQLADCDRDGFSLTLHGTDFAAVGQHAQLLIGPQRYVALPVPAALSKSLQLTWNGDLAATMSLVVEMGPGFESNLPLRVVQTEGSASMDKAYISYQPCSRGTFLSLNQVSPAGFSTAMCLPCAPGLFASQGAFHCQPCPPGYEAAPDQVACQICPAGTFRAGDREGPAACATCPAGRTSEAGARACQPCPAGSFQPAGSIRCQFCPRGKFQPNSGELECIPCQLGLVSLDEQGTYCAACPTGSLASPLGDECIPCPSGFYHSPSRNHIDIFAGAAANDSQQVSLDHSTAQDVCLQCPAGTIAPFPSSPRCQPCRPDTFRPPTDPAGIFCQPCASGTFASEAGATSCHLSPPGRVSQGLFGQAECTVCQPGKYQPFEGASECLDCPLGRQQPAAGQTTCPNCPIGKFAVDSSGECEPCPEGMWGDWATELDSGEKSQTTVCVLCPAGLFSAQSRTSCLCPAGTYNPALLPRPQPTAAGAFANSTNPIGTDEVAITANSTRCLPCPVGAVCATGPRHCLGGTEASCAPNREGTLCALCATGYTSFSAASDCVVCPTGTQSLVLTSFLMALLLCGVGGLYLAVLYSEDEREELARAVRRRFTQGLRSLSTLVPRSSTASFLSPVHKKSVVTPPRDDCDNIRMLNRPSFLSRYMRKDSQKPVPARRGIAAIGSVSSRDLTTSTREILATRSGSTRDILATRSVSAIGPVYFPAVVEEEVEEGLKGLVEELGQNGKENNTEKREAVPNLPVSNGEREASLEAGNQSRKHKEKEFETEMDAEGQRDMDRRPSRQDLEDSFENEVAEDAAEGEDDAGGQLENKSPQGRPCEAPPLPPRPFRLSTSTTTTTTAAAAATTATTATVTTAAATAETATSAQPPLPTAPTVQQPAEQSQASPTIPSMLAASAANGDTGAASSGPEENEDRAQKQDRPSAVQAQGFVKGERKQPQDSQAEEEQGRHDMRYSGQSDQAAPDPRHEQKEQQEDEENCSLEKGREETQQKASHAQEQGKESADIVVLSAKSQTGHSPEFSLTRRAAIVDVDTLEPRQRANARPKKPSSSMAAMTESSPARPCQDRKVEHGQAERGEGVRRREPSSADKDKERLVLISYLTGRGDLCCQYHSRSRLAGLTSAIKILVNFFQITFAVAAMADIPLPARFLLFAASLKVFNLDLVPWSFVDCVFPVSFYVKILIAGLLPLCLFALSLLLLTLCLARHHSRTARQARAVSVTSVSPTRAPQRPRQRFFSGVLWQRYLRLFFFTLCLIYPSVSSRLLQFFSCVQIQGVWLHSQQLDQPCFDESWMFWLPYFTALTLLYPFGIPVFLYVRMRSLHRRGQLGKPDIQRSYGILYQAYDRQSWCFELFDMSYKLWMSSALLFFPLHLRLQVALLSCLCFLTLLLWTNPFLRSSEDRLQQLCQVEILLLLSLALTTHTLGGTLDPVLELCLSVLLIGLCVTLVFYFCLLNSFRFFARTFRRYLRRRARDLGKLAATHGLQVSLADLVPHALYEASDHEHYRLSEHPELASGYGRPIMPETANTKSTPPPRPDRTVSSGAQFMSSPQSQDRGSPYAPHRHKHPGQMESPGMETLGSGRLLHGMLLSGNGRLSVHGMMLSPPRADDHFAAKSPAAPRIIRFAPGTIESP